MYRPISVTLAVSLTSIGLADVENGGFEESQSPVNCINSEAVAWRGCPVPCTPTANSLRISTDANCDDFALMTSSDDTVIRLRQSDFCIDDTGEDWVTLQFDAWLTGSSGDAEVRFDPGNGQVTRCIPTNSGWTTYKLSVEVTGTLGSTNHVEFRLAGDESTLRIDNVSVCFTEEDETTLTTTCTVGLIACSTLDLPPYFGCGTAAYTSPCECEEELAQAHSEHHQIKGSWLPGRYTRSRWADRPGMTEAG